MRSEPTGWTRQLRVGDPTRLFVKGLKLVLSMLLGVLLLALVATVAKTALDLRFFLSEELEEALRRILLDALIALALVEVQRTILVYLTEGRVKVTFIIDTVLVVMLTEVISLWFRGADWEHVAGIAALVLMLGVMRVLSIRYSPTADRAKVPPDNLE